MEGAGEEEMEPTSERELKERKRGGGIMQGEGAGEEESEQTRGSRRRRKKEGTREEMRERR